MNSNILYKTKTPSHSARGSHSVPGGVLLSHGEAPHYHRRCCVSLLSSAWVQVVPQLYGRQENRLHSIPSDALHQIRVILFVSTSEQLKIT